MIYSIPNPKMTSAEVREFRRMMRNCISGNFSPEEKRIIEERKKRIQEVGKNILKQHGGKNPILGY